MKIHFSGTTNMSSPMLNGIILVMPDKEEITLDREDTEWSYNEETKEISITFGTPYVWDGDGMEYDGKTIVDYIDKAKYFLTDIEEDAPIDYEISIKELSFIDSSGVLHSLKHCDTAKDYNDYLMNESKNVFTVYQLKKDVLDYQEIAFESLSWIRKHGCVVKRENYNKVYEGPYRNTDTLEGLYTRFNLARPSDFKGHSMSVSDVVVVKADGKEIAYYVDSKGFASVPEFLD